MGDAGTDNLTKNAPFLPLALGGGLNYLLMRWDRNGACLLRGHCIY